MKSLILASILLATSQDPHAIIDAVLAAARALEGSPTRAIVVFDLDDTLFDPGPRNVRILQDLVASHPGRFPTIEQRIGTLTPAECAYAITDTARSLGVVDREGLKAIRDFWGPRFFGNDYLRYDAPNPGAVEYVKELAATGALVVYLTGRDRHRMKEGTEAALRAAGFPLEPGVALLMLKPDWRFRDVAYKDWAVGKLLEMGRVVGAFDNEPANANLFRRGFREAHVVHLATRQSPRAVPLIGGVVSVKDFRRR